MLTIPAAAQRQGVLSGGSRSCSRQASSATATRGPGPESAIDRGGQGGGGRKAGMGGLGPRCASMLLDGLGGGAGPGEESPAGGGGMASRQGLLWKAAPYSEEAPAITTAAELAG